MESIKTKFPRGISDQAISEPSSTEQVERAPGPGLRGQAKVRKLQALKLQAASIKPQAASVKLQAASYKLPNLQAFIKFQAASIRGLDADESIVWMFHVKRYLVW